MSRNADRPFSRLYAQLRREAGDPVDEPEERAPLDPLGSPKVANPRRLQES